LRKKNFKENRDLEGQKDFSNFEEFNMSKKKDTELEIIDTADGAVIKSGKKTIAEIKEKSGNFVIVFSGKETATVTSFEAALEEAIMAYNLSI
jgi:hypothetical protein